MFIHFIRAVYQPICMHTYRCHANNRRTIMPNFSLSNFPVYVYNGHSQMASKNQYHGNLSNYTPQYIPSSQLLENIDDSPKNSLNRQDVFFDANFPRNSGDRNDSEKCDMLQDYNNSKYRTYHQFYSNKHNNKTYKMSNIPLLLLLNLLQRLEITIGNR